MKMFLRHEHPGPKALHGRRGHKLLKKMAKLERKLGKYRLNEESAEESCSSAGSPVRSRSRRRNRGGRPHRHRRPGHGRRCASLGGRDGSSSSSRSSSSSSDSDSCSGTSASSSSSSDSSRSPSPGRHRRGRHHHRYGHGPGGGHLSRSKSFAGRGCSSPPHSGPPAHRHRGHHHRDHHHGHHDHGHGHWRHRGMHSRHGDGICGRFFRLLARSEPNLQEAELPNGEEVGGEGVDREPEVIGINAQEGGQEDNVELQEGPELPAKLSAEVLEVLKKGLPADSKRALLRKYPVSKNPVELSGPKLNRELLPVASATAVKRDAVLLYEQKQLGAGLTVLGEALHELNAKAEEESDERVIPILNAMENATAIIADVHHNITQMRQAFLGAKLHKRVRPLVDTCKADEFLFGKDFGDRVKDVRAFAKGKKGCEKKEKRKHVDLEGERRKSKRLHHHGIVH